MRFPLAQQGAELVGRWIATLSSDEREVFLEFLRSRADPLMWPGFNALMWRACAQTEDDVSNGELP